MTKILAAILVLTAATVAQVPVPSLPKAYIDTTYIAPTGVTWAAHTSTSFQSALNSASPGDTIVLDAGVTYKGNFTLPVKLNSSKKWIYIVGSALTSLPAPGTRVNPATDAAKMPKIVSPYVTSVITVPPGANYYRLIGLEITSASTQGCSTAQNCYTTVLVNAASVPGHPLVDSITVDRCYIHASPTIDAREGVAANGSNIAVVDSYISDIHQSQNDSQAVVAYFSPGPIKIVNNYLEATGENIMFGGAGGLSNPWVPSDIEIRGNWLFKPLSWAAVGVTISPGNRWAVKNLLELKSARRVLFDGNLLENNWVSGQAGFAVAFTPRTNATGGSGLLAVVDDITFSNNTLKNVSSGFTISATDGPPNCIPSNGCTSVGELRRVVIKNNLILLGDTTQPGYTKGSVWGGQLLSTPSMGITDLVFQHNTVIPPPNLGYCKESIYIDTPNHPPVPGSATHNLWILDNVLCRQVFGPWYYMGSSPSVITNYMGDPAPPEPRFVGNVFYAPKGDNVYPLPLHNYVSTVPFTYVNPGSGNYQLSVPTWTDTSDGKISGVNSSTPPAVKASNLKR